MTAREKLDLINSHLDKGHTVYHQTCTRATKITAATRKRFVDRGHQLFKIAGSDLFIARGRSWDCIHSGTIAFGTIRVFDES